MNADESDPYEILLGSVFRGSAKSGGHACDDTRLSAWVRSTSSSAKSLGETDTSHILRLANGKAGRTRDARESVSRDSSSAAKAWAVVKSGISSRRSCWSKSRQATSELVES